MEEPELPRPSPKIRICASGDRVLFNMKSHRHHLPTDGQPDSARRGFGDRLHGKDTSTPREVDVGERRWYVVAYTGRNVHEPKMIPKELTKVLRSGPHFHDVDGASLWTSVIQKSYGRVFAH